MTDILTAGMDNVLAWRIGRAVCAAFKAPAGDYIDRGLALREILEKEGIGLVQLDPNSPYFGGRRK